MAKDVATDLYEKIALVSAENRRLRARLKKIWGASIAGRLDAKDKGAVAWRYALEEIEALSG